MSKLIQPITLDMLHTPNARLLKFRQEHPCRYLDVAGVRWEYLVGGEGTQGAETLLLLTGSLRVAETAFVYVGLFENSYRVIVPTYPPVETIDEIIQGVAAILDAEHASQVLVLGQSYGGLMAHAFVSRCPDRVKKIVFSSAGPFALTEGQQKLLKIIADLFSRLPDRLLKWLWLRTLRPLISVPPAETAFWQSYLTDLFERRLTKADIVSHFQVAAEAFKKYGYTFPAQARWPGPALIIGGAKDPASTQSDRQQIAEFYPQARIHVIPNAGHTVGMNKPEEYVTAVQEFFESADGSYLLHKERRVAVSAQVSDETCWWPSPNPSIEPAGVVVVTVNYNTKRLVALLLWSLHRFLGSELQSVVVVDNGSSDGSTEILQACARAGLCELLLNTTNRYHGPATTQALSHVAARFSGTQGSHPWVWLLDSDCVVARPDAATAAMSAAKAAGAALLGEAAWNKWHEDLRLSGYSLLIDPARAWRPEIGPFVEGGDPVGDFEQSCRRLRVPIATFPFTASGFVIHLGRGTLAGVYERRETSNVFFDWAADHHEPHFQQVAEAQARYSALRDEFDLAVGDLQPEQLVSACRRA